MVNLKPKIVQFKTKVVRNDFDPSFGETFSIFLHHMQVMEAIEASGAWTVDIDLYDWDRYTPAP